MPCVSVYPALDMHLSTGLKGREMGVAQMVKSLPAMWETQVQSLGREDPLEQEMATHSSILPGKSYGWRSLTGYSPWGCRELDTTERLTHTYTKGRDHYHLHFVGEKTKAQKGLVASHTAGRRQTPHGNQRPLSSVSQVCSLGQVTSLPTLLSSIVR